LVSDEPYQLANSKVLVGLAANAKIPAMYPFRDLAAAGGLMAYSADFLEVNRAAGRQMAEILRGTSAAEIPVYQPTKFQLIINTKTAQKIGLDLPPVMLARADEVIE
jgi:putative ABC transport system substrate-binding protein